MSKIIKIEYRDLLQADIIVTASTGAGSKFIRGGTGGAVSHAMVYLGQDMVVEAVPTYGVRENLINNALKDVFFAVALRHSRLNPGQRQQVSDNARKYLGRGYDYVGAAGAGATSGPGATIAVSVYIIPGLGALAGWIGGGVVANNAREKNADDKFFCSELVAKAFEDAGARLTDSKPSYTYPNMILRSSALRYVGHLRGA
jgi:uncharacterized protein YycO